MKDDPQPAGRRQATVLESVEEVREQIRRARTAKEVAAPAAEAPKPAAAATVDDATPFRPVARSPMAVLTALDDGSDQGQEIRLRGPSFAIGRVEGDLVIPHDGGMSGRHAELSRRLVGGHHRWYLRDLDSTNGTFARAASVILLPGQEFLVGGLRLAFEPPAAPEDPSAGVVGTMKWRAPAAGVPEAGYLVEQTPEGPGRRHAIREGETWVGRDPARCDVVLDDPTVSPRHAKVARDDRGRWVIANAGSRNGLWGRIDDVWIGTGAQFQCGEQRFLIRVL